MRYILIVLFFLIPVATHAASNGPARIFIMPGHEPSYGGAEYKNLKERDMNLKVAEYLEQYLAADPDFDAIMGRDERGWNLALSTYFNDEWDNIASWARDFKKFYADREAEGTFRIEDGNVPHQTVNDAVALRLYGINKWVGEHRFDLAVHIHFNDYGGRLSDHPGDYSGFAVYVPEARYRNAEASRKVGESIANRLRQFVGESDAPKETGGVVEDQELIAVGAYGTASFPSVLIEYGYIYEPQFQNKDTADLTYREYAYQTYLAIKDVLGSGTPVPRMGSTALLPYQWTNILTSSLFANTDTLALQYALHLDGTFPPEGKSLNACPLSGIYGLCTRAAVKAFQVKHEIAGNGGSSVGTDMIRTLNEIYGFGNRD